jgi:hypothetical protein
MLAAPSPAAMRFMERERAGAARRATNERKAAYRAALLRWTAGLLDEQGDERPSRFDFDLTAEQARSARNALAQVLRNRADSNAGRLGRAR